MRHHLKKFSFAMLSGLVLFQVPACADAALAVTTLSSAVTAGGVVYLVYRVID